MAERKAFLVRLPPELLEELNRWAADELRSVNAQIEYLLREALRQRRRKQLPPEPASSGTVPPPTPGAPPAAAEPPSAGG